MDEIGLHRAGRRGRQWLNLRDREGWVAYLTGNASRDDDDVSALEGLVELVGRVAVDLARNGVRLHVARAGRVKAHLALGVDVGDIGSNTGRTANIVEGELGDVGVELEEEGQGLANSSTGTEDGDLGLASGGGGEGAGVGGEGAGSGTSEHGWRGGRDERGGGDDEEEDKSGEAAVRRGARVLNGWIGRGRTRTLRGACGEPACAHLACLRHAWRPTSGRARTSKSMPLASPARCSPPLRTQQTVDRR